MRHIKCARLWPILVLLVSCREGPEEYLLDHKKDILRIEADALSIPADGKSALKISAIISKKADLRTIKFSATSGKFRFSDSSLYTVDAALVNEEMLADAFLISGTKEVNDVLVKISANTVDTLLHLKFDVAYADSVVNESAVAFIKRGYGSEVPVKTILFRKSGKPSENQKVDFRAITSNDLPIGEFRAISQYGSDNDGVVNSVFVLKDTIYTGPLRIISKYKGSKTYADTLLIYVTSK